MTNWKTLKIGDKVKYEFNDFDGNGIYYGTITHIYENYPVAEINGMDILIDDFSAELFTKIK